MVLTDESWYVVRNIRGCTGFVVHLKANSASDEEIARLGVEKKEVEVSTALAILLTLLMVRLTDFTGIVEEIDVEKNCPRNSIYVRRETPVELELDQAEAVE